MNNLDDGSVSTLYTKIIQEHTFDVNEQFGVEFVTRDSLLAAAVQLGSFS